MHRLLPFLLPAVALAQGVAPRPSPVQVTGPSGSPVETQLNSATLDTLVAPTCLFSLAPPVIALSTTPVDVPPSPMPARTRVIIKNVSNAAAEAVWCCCGAECEPTSTAAYVIPVGDFQAFPARDSDTIRCRSATGTAEVNVQEESCG